MRPTTGTTTYAGYRTRTLSVEGSGPRFVLLHGYSDSANTWEGVLSELASLQMSGAGGSAIAVDLPGFGRADRLSAGPMLPQFDAFVDELVADQALRGPVVLVGNSLGGTVAVRAASRGVPLLGVVSIGDPAGGRSRLRSWIGAPRTPLPMRLAGLPVPLPAALVRVAGRALYRHLVYADRRAVDSAVIERYVSFIEESGGPSWVVRNVTMLAKELAGGHGEIRVDRPLLIVHGRKDRIVPVACSEAMHASLPGSELLLGARWGHCPQLDDPAGVTEAITAAAAAWIARAPHVADDPA